MHIFRPTGKGRGPIPKTSDGSTPPPPPQSGGSEQRRVPFETSGPRSEKVQPEEQPELPPQQDVGHGSAESAESVYEKLAQPKEAAPAQTDVEAETPAPNRAEPADGGSNAMPSTRGPSVGSFKDGPEVFDRLDSHMATHAEGDTELPKLARQAISKLETGGRRYIEEEVRFDHPVGETARVSITNEEIAEGRVYWAQREGRPDGEYMTFVEGREKEPTEYVTVLATRQDDSAYRLESAWTGRRAPALPNTRWAEADSIPFWTQHALVDGSERIKGEKLRTCPWNDGDAPTPTNS